MLRSTAPADSVNVTVRNEGEIQIYTTVWTIPNFIRLLNNKYSPKVRDTESSGNGDVKFRYKMQFLGHNNDIVEIYYLPSTSVFLKSVFTVCLRRCEDRSIDMQEYQTVSANKWLYVASFFKRDIENYDSRDTFLFNDGSLRLKFQFLVTTDVKIKNLLIPEAQLNNDFENLLQNGLFADVIVKSLDDIEYKTHKAVLASRSPVLRALFEHNMKERRTNIVESPLESEVLQEVLTFIYSDKAPKVDEIPEKLIAAADYYQLTRLKCLCEQALQKKLTVDNAIDTLQLADLHSAPVLKKMTLAFIKDGYAELITQTEGWAKINSIQLIKTIYQFIVSDELDEEVS